MHSGATDAECGGDELEEEEIVREAALRLVTRDMADVLGVLCFSMLCCAPLSARRF